MRALADIVAFNEAHADGTLRFGQDLFLAAATTRGDLSEIEYLAARQMDLRSARISGLDAYMDRHRLDAVLFPAAAGAAIAAKAGYPSVQVPAGFVGRRRHPGISVWRHLHRSGVERARPLALRLCLRAGDPSPPPAAAHRDLV